MTKTYRLRPHHIKFLYGFISEGEEGIRKDINSPYPESFSNPDSPNVEYSLETVDSVVRYCNELIADKNASLEIVDGIDDICLLGCNRRCPSCEEKDDFHSIQKMNNVFGLKVDGNYRVADIVEKMQKLKEYSLNVKS